MKRLILFFLIITMIAFSVTSYADDTDIKEWDMSVPTEITEDVQRIFDKAMEDRLGVDYVPVAVLGEADGVYCILCKATVVIPDAEPYNVLVYVGEDGVHNIYDLWIEKHAEKVTEMDGTYNCA